MSYRFFVLLRVRKVRNYRTVQEQFCALQLAYQIIQEKTNIKHRFNSLVFNTPLSASLVIFFYGEDTRIFTLSLKASYIVVVKLG